MNYLFALLYTASLLGVCAVAGWIITRFFPSESIEEHDLRIWRKIAEEEKKWQKQSDG